MMRWAEQPADTVVRPLSELISKLSFIDAALICRACRADPLVFVLADCRQGIEAHLHQSRTELGGLMLGRVYASDFEAEEQPGVIVVRRALASRDFDATGVSLRMDTGVWDQARVAQDSAGDQIVGWYHSHPNLGAFFSSTDRHTQARFFAHPYSLGLVVDPVRVDEKWFRGPQAQEIRAERVITCDITGTLEL